MNKLAKYFGKYEDLGDLQACPTAMTCMVGIKRSITPLTMEITLMWTTPHQALKCRPPYICPSQPESLPRCLQSRCQG